jgi:hypothetical protein
MVVYVTIKTKDGPIGHGGIILRYLYRLKYPPENNVEANLYHRYSAIGICENNNIPYSSTFREVRRLKNHGLIYVAARCLNNRGKRVSIFALTDKGRRFMDAIKDLEGVIIT